MKAVIEKLTYKVLYLFQDSDEVEITDDGLFGPRRALDIKPETHEVIDVSPPEFWIGGGILGHDGSDWLILDQEKYDELYEASQPKVVFPTLTRKELRNGLLTIGLTASDIEAHILAIEDPYEREAALIDWQETENYERSHPLVNDIATTLGLPEEQVDALWIWSSNSVQVTT